MTENNVTIFKPSRGASEVTAAYMDSQRVELGKSHRAHVKVEIEAKTYRDLGPIAARQGLGISAFINRILEGVVETAPQLEGEHPFSG